MKNPRRTLFISDLHLDNNQPKITHIFINFLKNDLANVDALYILGDLFEAWIGDDNLTDFNKMIFSALRTASSSTPIYFIHGNRDFLIGQGFEAATGCKILAEETPINLYGEKVLLMHGDTLCTLDKNYLRARKILRNTVLQKMFLKLPLFLRRKIADMMRNKSKKYTQTMSMEMMDVSNAAVDKVLQKHQLPRMIHGHTHRPAIHEKRIVLAAWHLQGNKLEWDETGSLKLVNFE